MRKLRQSERTDLSDRRMVEAAIQIMLESGIAGLRLSDVGLRAGYSRGLAAMRFGTLGSLLRRVAEQLDESWIAKLGAAVRDKRGLAALYAAVDAQEMILRPPASNLRVQYLILFNSLDPGNADRLNVSRVIAAQRADLARWTREAVEDGDARPDLDVEAEAASLLSSFIGMIFQSLLDPTVRPEEMCVKLKAEIEARLASPTRTTRATSLRSSRALR